ncbi:uncharacterized protein YukE [Saccharomonospora amisosensis]|uniref:Uncharacterized protein YukE n=1 Tax=Saccharomonospora amisosensis TaxID=1128677 RepID=A0A7X5UUH7_9PSEU|nr:hypothetical protein [Saccharomonospora amisosensis]NIJ14476.1 uncharacterized protein YukE [Saccharomonospora amisosensis]
MVYRITQAVHETGADAVNYADLLRQLFDDLKAKAQSICGSEWEGAASAEFIKAEHKWDLEATALGDAHTKVGQLTQTAVENGFNADHRGAALFST